MSLADRLRGPFAVLPCHSVPGIDIRHDRRQITGDCHGLGCFFIIIIPRRVRRDACRGDDGGIRALGLQDRQFAVLHLVEIAVCQHRRVRLADTLGQLTRIIALLAVVPGVGRAVTRGEKFIDHADIFRAGIRVAIDDACQKPGKLVVVFRRGQRIILHLKRRGRLPPAPLLRAVAAGIVAAFAAAACQRQGQ